MTTCCNNVPCQIITEPMPYGSKMLGEIMVPDVTRTFCPVCHQTTLDFTNATKITSYVRAAERQRLGMEPIHKFVGLAEAIELSGLTSDKFVKNKRIQRGFIYSIKVGGRRLYHVDSLAGYHETNGEGRIPLNTGKVYGALRSYRSRHAVDERGDGIELADVLAVAYKDKDIGQALTELELLAEHIEAEVGLLKPNVSGE